MDQPAAPVAAIAEVAQNTPAEFSLADYPPMPPVPAAEQRAALAHASHPRRRLLGIGALMLTAGGYLGAIRGAYEGAFTPTDIKIGPHDAVIQMTTGHQENIDLGFPGNLSRQTDWVANAGVSIRLQGIPNAPGETSTRQQATANVINQYKEAFGNKHVLDDAEHTFFTRVWHDAVEGGIIGGTVGLGLFGLGLGARALSSDKRRQAFRDALAIETTSIRRLVYIGGLVGSLAAGTVLADGGIVPTPPSHHVAQSADPNLAGTPLQGFTVNGQELQLAIDYALPLVLNEVHRNDAYYTRIEDNFKKAFKQKFGTTQLQHKGVMMVQKVSDNHCNMEMDRVHGAVTRAFDSNLTLDSGDMTWWGSDAEEMCIAEEADAIVSHNPEAVVMGNHDSPVIAEAARKHKMVVLDNDKVVKVAGFKLLGEADVNSSDMGTQLHQRGDETTADEAEKVKNAACAQHPDIVVIHEPAEAALTAESGCAPETDYGHDHVEHNPYVTNKEAGSIAMDAGTSGGAAKGSPTYGPLGKVATELECEYTIDTHRLLGCYVISAQPDGSVTISDFIPNPATQATSPLTETPLADAAGHH